MIMAVMKHILRPFLWTLVVTAVYASASIGLAALSGGVAPAESARSE
jgi:hypothetical protein